ncbi:phytoene desaturase family protein [Salipaludibacillus sp. CF4.18]|uniref:phytoene desaturase family protein n=1 Tax=Salipaludibacillus sp. CF4.18 TaxID=3373081 RepID=UPI003EE56ACD
MNKRVTIVGSGFGGLTAGDLLQKQGYNVTVLEAAVEWGGCAGKFQRKDFTFPVGATLAMGFEKNGLHKQINDYLGFKTESYPLEKVMDVRIGERIIPYHTDRDLFLKVWEKEEPKHIQSIRKFFQEVWSIGQILLRHMLQYPVFPPKSRQETFSILRGVKPNSIRLLPYIGRSLSYLVKKYNLENCKTFIHFINGVLMDSMQTTYEDCEILMGATALDIYHHGAFYVDGGLFVINSKRRNQMREERIQFKG